jgi:pyruvate/2-oxoglutarate dehydrogenase complex dihydrolipoamide dehydrogenase (E3) component
MQFTPTSSTKPGRVIRNRRSPNPTDSAQLGLTWRYGRPAEDDFRIIRDNLAGGKRSTRDRLVPYCVFTDPPLAHVGLSEGEAQRQGVAASIGKLPTSAVLRAQAIGEKQGFMKVLVDANDDRILGFTMIGSEAGEVMAVVQTAMLAGLPYTRLRDAVLTHPTLAEGLGFLLANVPAHNVRPATPQTLAV